MSQIYMQPDSSKFRVMLKLETCVEMINSGTKFSRTIAYR